MANKERERELSNHDEKSGTSPRQEKIKLEYRKIEDKDLQTKTRKGKQRKLAMERCEDRRTYLEICLFGDKASKKRIRNQVCKRKNEKSKMTMKQVWRLGGRKFKDDFKKKMMPFDY